MTKNIRWGILGTGDVCRQFAADLEHVDGAELYGVGSRNLDRAENFAHEHGVPVAFGSYESLVSDPHIDVVYIGTPNTRHLENTLLCLRGGKHVLCEKPLGVNSTEVEQMFVEAERRGLFLMEAMWTYFFPAIQRAREWIQSGRIGKPMLVRADFHYAASYDPTNRLFDPNLAGGALLDIGVYPLALAQLVFGRAPDRIGTMADMAESGVDRQGAAILQYDHQGMAILTFGFQTDAPQTAMVAGDRGFIELPHPFYQPDSVTMAVDDNREHHSFSRHGYGYSFEAQHVTECLQQGATQSDIMPTQASRLIIRTLDRIRSEWSLTYPGEQIGEAV